MPGFVFKLGDEGQGVRTIIRMVHHTRLDTAMAPAGLMRAALAEALHWARHRTAFQRKLIDQPLMRAVLADLALDAEAGGRLHEAEVRLRARVAPRDCFAQLGGALFLGREALARARLGRDEWRGGSLSLRGLALLLCAALFCAAQHRRERLLAVPAVHGHVHHARAAGAGARTAGAASRWSRRERRRRRRSRVVALRRGGGSVEEQRRLGSSSLHLADE